MRKAVRQHALEFEPTAVRDQLRGQDGPHTSSSVAGLDCGRPKQGASRESDQCDDLTFHSYLQTRPMLGGNIGGGEALTKERVALLQRALRRLVLARSEQSAYTWCYVQLVESSLDAMDRHTESTHPQWAATRSIEMSRTASAYRRPGGAGRLAGVNWGYRGYHEVPLDIPPVCNDRPQSLHALLRTG